MKFILSRPALFIALFSLTALFCNFGCSKQDKTDTDKPDDKGLASTDVMPGNNTPYMACHAPYGLNGNSNQEMMIAVGTIASLRISVRDDTTSFDLTFSN